jgi:hypothetical protein
VHDHRRVVARSEHPPRLVHASTLPCRRGAAGGAGTGSGGVRRLDELHGEPRRRAGHQQGRSCPPIALGDYAIWFARKSYEHMARVPAPADAEIAPGARATMRR